jgi:hypothetical protein
MSATILDRLRDEVEGGDPWLPHTEPEHPNPLVGEFVAWTEGTTKDGTKACAVAQVLEQGTGKLWSVWTWHAALRAQLTGNKDKPVPVEQRPARPGCFVAIRWTGKRVRQDGDGETHGYRTAISEPDQAAIDTEPDDDDPTRQGESDPFDEFPEGF